LKKSLVLLKTGTVTMPPKKNQLKGGLFDPSSMNVTLMKSVSDIQMLGNDKLADTYSSRNYMNASGGKKNPKKPITKKTPSKEGKKPNKK
jgi:hypothetical protein